MPRDDYEERQAARRDRLEQRAGDASAEARRRFATADAATAGIPMGQPILVGHHSEGRHRAALKRSDSNMRAGLAASDKATHLQRRADAVGTGGISSDDPEAVAKLRRQLADLEAQREWMKAINSAFKTGGWGAAEALEGVPALLVQAGKETLRLCPHHDRPFPSYALTNLGANICRIGERIQALEAEAARAPWGPIVGEGWRFEERADLNRIALSFDEKPAAAVLALLGGWHWSRRERAHLRLNNANGRAAAARLAEQLRAAFSP